jgi:1-deoxy-D-xylulose-5-phosphate synthase
MINTANAIDDRPSAFRFPRGDAEFEIDFSDNEILEIGKARIIQEGAQVAIISYGTILENVLAAVKILETDESIKVTIIDARFAKPFDENLVRELAKNHE